MQNELFSLYEITDRGSSWMGPLIVAYVSNKYNNMRYAMIYVLFAFLLSFPIIYFFVDFKKGVQQSNLLHSYHVSMTNLNVKLNQQNNNRMQKKKKKVKVIMKL